MQSARVSSNSICYFIFTTLSAPCGKSDFEQIMSHKINSCYWLNQFNRLMQERFAVHPVLNKVTNEARSVEADASGAFPSIHWYIFRLSKAFSAGEVVAESEAS